jgi:PmbA protein
VSGKQELRDVARRVAAMAQAGEQVEAYVVRMHDTEVKVFDGEVESLSVAEVEGVGVRLLHDSRQGYAWAGSLDPEVVAETVAEARDNAGFGTPDEFLGLPEPADVAGVPAADLDLWRDELLRTPTEQKVALALEVERATRAADPRVRGVESAEYGDGAVEVAVASSLGVESSARRTVCSVASFALAGEGAETQTGYGFSVGRTVDDLDVAKAARDAGERSTRLLGARQPESRRLPVVFDPLVTQSLLSLIGSTLSGEAVLKGRSLFADRVGEEVAAAGVTLVDDPTHPEAFGAATHDGEGVPTRRVDLVVDGRLQGFLQNVYSARRSSTHTTGSAVRGF